MQEQPYFWKTLQRYLFFPQFSTSLLQAIASGTTETAFSLHAASGVFGDCTSVLIAGSVCFAFGFWMGKVSSRQCASTISLPLIILVACIFECASSMGIYFANSGAMLCVFRCLSGFSEAFVPLSLIAMQALAIPLRSALPCSPLTHRSPPVTSSSRFARRF